MNYQKSLNNYQLNFLEFYKNFLFKNDFFLSGGTCITAFYYPIRYSDDLVFFSYKEIDNKTIFNFMDKYEKENNVKKILYIKKYDRRIFNIIYEDDFELKVEFTQYFKPLYDLNFSKDFDIYYLSEKDLIVDKLFLLHERNEIKDYFDFAILYKNIYFEIKEEILLDLLEQVYKKFEVNIHKNVFCKIFYDGGKKDYGLIKLLENINLNSINKFYLEFAKSINCL